MGTIFKENLKNSWNKEEREAEEVGGNRIIGRKKTRGQYIPKQ